MPSLSGAIVSRPTTPIASAGVSAAPSHSVMSGPTVVYVSLLPGTMPRGVAAAISNARTASQVSVTIADGGFDPVAVAAGTGDTLGLDIEVSDGGAPLRFALPVPATRPPVVVRTEPPPKKRDVALNATIVVVFSEPIDGTTITTQSVRLLSGGAPVSGRPVLAPDGLRVEFRPGQPLVGSTTYTLAVTTDVTDLGGDHLEHAESVSFTTVAWAPVASVTVSPAHDTLWVGDSVPLVATAKDAAGQVLGGRTESWSSSDSTVIAISSGGVATAVGAGSVRVTATVEQQQGTAQLTVYSGGFGSLEILNVTLGGGFDIAALGGYQVSVDGVASAAMATNGSTRFDGIRSGIRTIALTTGVGACVVASGSRQRATVSPDAVTYLTFVLTCPVSAELIPLRILVENEATGDYLPRVGTLSLADLTSTWFYQSQQCTSYGDRMPAGAPDGVRIAFVSYGCNPFYYEQPGLYPFANPYVGSVAGGDGWALATTHASLALGPSSAPAWSPDGSRIAFVIRDASHPPCTTFYMPASACFGGNIVVRSADPADSTPALLLTAGGLDWSPSWSPDGLRVAFTREDDPATGASSIWVVGADGTGAARLPGSAAGWAGSMMPLWSPDGSRIAFSGGPQFSSQIYVMGRDGSGLVAVTAGGESKVASGWSPDGQYIVFRMLSATGSPQPATISPGIDLYLLDVKGGGVVRLTGGARWDYDYQEYRSASFWRRP